MTYREHAKQARLNAGYSLTELEKKAGLSHNVISKIERGRNLPTFHTLMAVTKALGIGVDEYFGIKPVNFQWDRSVLDVGERTRLYRRRLELSVFDLADLSGIAEHTIWAIEAGRSKPTAETMLALANALGISPDEYLGLPCPIERFRR